MGSDGCFLTNVMHFGRGFITISGPKSYVCLSGIEIKDTPPRSAAEDERVCRDLAMVPMDFCSRGPESKKEETWLFWMGESAYGPSACGVMAHWLLVWMFSMCFKCIIVQGSSLHSENGLRAFGGPWHVKSCREISLAVNLQHSQLLSNSCSRSDPVINALGPQ